MAIAVTSHWNRHGSNAGTLQLAPSRQKVVRAGNIGKFSQVLRQSDKGLSLQTRRMTDDDLEGAFAAGLSPGSVLSGARARQECESNDL